MKILVTNDDGISAKGIQVLTKALSEVPGTEVYVCAPSSQKSACGHGITTSGPIMVWDAELEGATMAWKITGTPADCVKFAHKRLQKEFGVEIDAVFSGINHGANIGTDVLYSGTVSGAIEGLLCGMPSVAISVGTHLPKDKQLEDCSAIIQDLLIKAIPNMDKNTCLNVNIPDVDYDNLKGLKVTRLGPREYDESFNLISNPRGESYYWYTGNTVTYEDLPETYDVMAQQDGYVTITPLHFDLTKYELQEQVKSWNIKY